MSYNPLDVVVFVVVVDGDIDDVVDDVIVFVAVVDPRDLPLN